MYLFQNVICILRSITAMDFMKKWYLQNCIDKIEYNQDRKREPKAKSRYKQHS